jgi:acyl-CoA thioester hydrolase
MSREPLHGREAYPHWVTIQTRWDDNDIYGHANNTVYYRWFDTVVNCWLMDAGLLQLEGGTGPIGLMVESGCRYAASVAYPEPVEIGLAVEKIGNSSVTYRLGVFAEGSADAAAQGRYTHVYVDRETRRPTSLPNDWRTKLGELQA